MFFSQQEESDAITRDLLIFADKMKSTYMEFHNCQVFRRECTQENAANLIEHFDEVTSDVKKEAQDLKQLQVKKICKVTMKFICPLNKTI